MIDNSSIRRRQKAIGIVCFVLFLVVMYFPTFLHLTKLPIELWDESLFSLRAIYMAKTGSYMSNFNLFNELPNHLNTKLPFTTFFQVLSIKLFGINELAIRLPIALIFLTTVGVVCWYFLRYYQALPSGYVFGLVLVTSLGFVMPHMLRSGDQDVPFACYVLLSVLCWDRYMKQGKASALAGFTLLFIAALLTKNLLAGLIIPGIALHVLFEKRLLSILKDYRIYLAIAAVCLAYFGTIYYLDSQYPGFISRMWHYELGGRYSNVIEEHKGPFLTYVMDLAFKDFVPYLFLLCLSIALHFDSNMSKETRSTLRLFGLVFLSYLLIISTAQTKTFWYIAPLYTFGAFILALSVQHLYSTYLQHLPVKLRMAMLGSTLLAMAIPYGQVIENVFEPVTQYKDAKYGNMIGQMKHYRPDVKTFTLVDNNFGTSAYFYKEKYNAIGQDYNISYKRYIDLVPNQYVVTCLQSVMTPIHKNYTYSELFQFEDCKLIQIQTKKEEEHEAHNNSK
jgi:4-amino-4-deoxy-L-arabinose transferase-like glycosyltransferase